MDRVGLRCVCWIPMHAALALLLFATGCKALFGLEDPTQRPDGPPVPDVDARLQWGTDVEITLDAAPTAAIDDLSGAFDTGTAPACDPNIAAYCVVAGTDVTLPAGKTLVVTGPRPLIVIALGTLTVAGTLDAGSTSVPLKSAPAAGATTCSPFAAAPSSRGGGAGGSFAGAGGAGAGAINPTTGNGGSPAAIVTSIEFRAGCRGQDGGNPTANRYGLGGLGGGAIYLLAGTAIEITGTVNASGAAGTGGECIDGGTSCADSLGAANGAGGGGSGGMIVLEASAVRVTGLVFADGGGGGEGSSRTFDGTDGKESTGTEAALGGSDLATTNGGDGGNGAHGATAAGATAMPGDDPRGGGGGGGGIGVIRVHGASSITGGGTVSPPAS